MLAVPTLLWAAAVGTMWFKQESLLFVPQPLASDYRFDLPDTQEEWVDVPGARLHALHLRQPLVSGQRSTRGIVFFLRGNSGNLASWFTNPAFWRRSGYDVFMLDYRGFGKSTGRIESEAQLHDDVLRAWQQVAPEYAGKKRVIYGRSLGSGLAAHLATQVPADLLVLVSPYQSMVQLAEEFYPWVPQAVLRYPLRTDQYLPQVHERVLIVHGVRDALIPVAHAQRLQSLNQQAHLLLLPEAGHADVHQFGDYTQALLQELARL